MRPHHGQGRDNLSGAQACATPSLCAIAPLSVPTGPTKKRLSKRFSIPRAIARPRVRHLHHFLFSKTHKEVGTVGTTAKNTGCPYLVPTLSLPQGGDNSRTRVLADRSNASRPRVASGTWPDDQRLRSSIANAWLESSSMPWKWARSTPRSTGASASEPCGGIGRLSPRTPNSPRLSTKREDRTASRRKPSGARLECASCAAPSASSSSSSRTPTQSRSGRSLAPSRSSASCTPRNRHSPKTT